MATLKVRRGSEWVPMVGRLKVRLGNQWVMADGSEVITPPPAEFVAPEIEDRSREDYISYCSTYGRNAEIANAAELCANHWDANAPIAPGMRLDPNSVILRPDGTERFEISEDHLTVTLNRARLVTDASIGGGGNRYFEIFIDVTSAHNFGIGIAVCNWQGFSNPTHVGGSFGHDQNSVSMYWQQNAWHYDNRDNFGPNNTGSWLWGPGGQGAQIATGDTACFAVDLDNRLIWARVNNGGWSPGAGANPATGVGGLNFPGLNGPYFVGLVGLANPTLTANFGTTNFAFPVPDGFMAWQQ